MSAITTISHPTGELYIEEREDGLRYLKAVPRDPSTYVPLSALATRYSETLIRLIVDIKGVAWVCNEIEREESVHQVRSNLKFGLLAFLPAEAFKGKTILDFGCGAGASTVILGQMFPEARIVGLDFLEQYRAECEERARFYGLGNVSFESMPSADKLPEVLESFDFIVLSAVFEHLLPEERRTVFPELYGRFLKPGGIMFINELPYRYFPLERHTTGGLALLNYLPDWLAFPYARLFTHAVVDSTWRDFLRNGIRGGSVTEIKSLIQRGGYAVPEILEPCYVGVEDDIGLWAAMTKDRRPDSRIDRYVPFLRLIKRLTGLSMIHMLTLALRKPN